MAAISIETWLSVCVVVVLAVVAAWRWSVVNRPLLTDRRCDELSRIVLDHIFEHAPDFGVFVPVTVGSWRAVGMTDPEWIYLCRWMIGHGLVSGPDDWGRLALLLGMPPSHLALTRKTMGFAMQSQRQPDISIGDGNGPINIGGHQVVVIGCDLSGDELRALVDALRTDSQTQSELEASVAHAAADSIEAAAEGRLPANSPEVAGALNWVGKRVAEAVGSAGGAAMWAGTIAVAKALGWV